MSRRLGKRLKEVDLEKRKNPKSIRRLLHQWICDEYDRDVDAATLAVNSSRPPKWIRNSKRHPVYTDAFYHVINDDTHLQYYQVEAVARHHNIPIAALLLFTRAQSDLAREGYGEARALLTALTAFTNDLMKQIEERASRPAQEPESRAEFLDYVIFKTLSETHFPRPDEDNGPDAPDSM